jgi:hypothetical protein
MAVHPLHVLGIALKYEVVIDARDGGILWANPDV